jgi:pyruvate dehydrogenase E2 component (dihydrolipoamide acetyltransferase)
MAKEVFMPKLSSTMEIGTLLQWFKEEGDQVTVGDPLFEIMTDKINIEVEAYEEGILLKKYFNSDDEVPVNHVIGYIGNTGEQVPEQPPGESGSTSTAKQENKNEVEKVEVVQQKEEVILNTEDKPRATPAARKIAKEGKILLHSVVGTGPNGRIHAADVVQYLRQTATPKATPLAKKVAETNDIELTKVKGSGINGKIHRNDVEQKKALKSPGVPEQKTIKVDGVRRVVSKRMSESAFTAPHVTLNSEIDMSKVIEIRKQLLGQIVKQTGYRLSYTEIIMKAVALTLKNHPFVNASLQGDEIVLHQNVNVGLAVAIKNSLVVPVIKDADQKGLATLTEVCKKLGNAARENKLKPAEMSGGTFTISNLGMYAVDTFTPIINQPESAILGVGRIIEKPVVVEGRIVVRPMMGVSLSFDHRVMDGAPAAAFLTDVKEVLEQPFKLLM